jgi:predicted phage terminase large subunit-like protein
MASSTGGVGTGERVHFSINDDLLRANDAHSAAERAKAIGHMRAMSTRGVEPSTYGQVLIMQRLHNDDPAGWALKESGKKWEHLRLPAEYDAGRPCRTSIGWEDPRRNDGDLLWPERFSAEELAAQKIALGGYGYAAQFQQSPAPAGGGIFKLEWLEQFRYDARPESGRIIQSWDTASKSGELNDPSVCTTWLEHDGRLYLIDVLRKRMEYPELKRAVQSNHELHRPVSILIEDKSSGQALIQELRAKLPIIAITPTQDKVSRAAHVSPMVEAGRVWLPNSAPWLFEFEQELTGFPLTTSMPPARRWTPLPLSTRGTPRSTSGWYSAITPR